MHQPMCATEWTLRDATRVAAGSSPSTWFCSGKVLQQGTIGGYHLLLAPHSIGAWFALAFAAQIPFLEAATHHAIISQRACKIALLLAEVCAEHNASAFFAACCSAAHTSNSSCSRRFRKHLHARTHRVNAPSRDALLAAQQQVTRIKSGLPNLKLTTLNVSHRARHYTGRLESPAERPRRDACRRLHVSRRCT